MNRSSVQFNHTSWLEHLNPINLIFTESDGLPCLEFTPSVVPRTASGLHQMYRHVCLANILTRATTNATSLVVWYWIYLEGNRCCVGIALIVHHEYRHDVLRHQTQTFKKQMNNSSMCH